jgi:hypothetical protein
MMEGGRRLAFQADAHSQMAIGDEYRWCRNMRRASVCLGQTAEAAGEPGTRRWLRVQRVEGVDAAGRVLVAGRR